MKRELCALTTDDKNVALGSDSNFSGKHRNSQSIDLPDGGCWYEITKY